MNLIRSILIANRGEIASRIIRSCRKMGIRSIAVFSEADRQGLFVKEADVAICIGGSAPVESYLNQEKIIAAAKNMRADAIHPAYGFLSENALFAERCQKEGIIFIGPNPSAIEKMGSKAHAKAIMKAHGVPVIPGYEGEDQSIGRLEKEAFEIGFPVLLKASAGGGGRGMRIVEKGEDIEKAIESAQREAKSAFGNDRLIIEKYIASGRHIEFQIFGDQHGHVIHLFERECSIQRRYQKIIEESPSPALKEDIRTEMGKAAVNAARALAYDNAGTVEFILDEAKQEFFFLEVNTRLQVEHPVTEEVTNLDLVQMQIESAQGMPLSIRQEEVKTQGYAIECRLYAEDVDNDFMPESGKILSFELPEVDGLRLETGVANGSEVSIYYDAMLAKIIIKEDDRLAALRKMSYVLRGLCCQGVSTNQDLLQAILENPSFIEGIYDTHFISKQLNWPPKAQANKEFTNYAAIACSLYQWNKRNQEKTLLVSMPSGWRNSFYQGQQEKYVQAEEEFIVEYKFNKDSFGFIIEENTYQVTLLEVTEKQIRLDINSVRYKFKISSAKNDYYIQNEQFGNIHLNLINRFPESVVEQSAGTYLAPIPSQVVKIFVEPGREVKKGDPLLVLLSMKMENTIHADEDGIIDEVFADENENVTAGFVLLKMNL